jgi:hypothetical protein
MNFNIVQAGLKTPVLVSENAMTRRVPRLNLDDSRGNPIAIVAFIFSALGFFLLPLMGTVIGMILGYIAQHGSDYKGKRGGILASMALTMAWIQAAVLIFVGLVYVFGSLVSLIYL